MTENITDVYRHDARVRIGRVVADYRNRLGQVLTQERLAEELKVTRTSIAHLEEGRELVEADLLSRICDRLKVPDELWLAATHAFYIEGYVFHQIVCEMLGRRVSEGEHSATDQMVALDRAKELFTKKLTDVQAHAQINSLLIFYGERPMTKPFFDRYLGVDAFADNESFLKRIRYYQSEAMRLYGNFRRAFTRMSRVNDLDAELEPLNAKPTQRFKDRTPFGGIHQIAPDRLADLGYIAAQRIEQQNKDRAEVSAALLSLAESVEQSGASALTALGDAKLRRLRTLLRRLESPVQLEEGLFSLVDAKVLRDESSRIAPERQDLVRIADTQRLGLKNLGVYLSEPYMDVYVATSMREDADFQSVNSFVQQLFALPAVSQLNLRYFNPTQSWIEDRVAKGLVEALMLRRAAVTVYMAQKGDTFGKDSEASVALGQGKTVIVYVPRLFDEENGIDSEKIFRLDEYKLDQQLAKLEVTTEEGIDSREKAKQLLRFQLRQLTVQQLTKVVWKHWADFDLLAEAARIENANLRASVIKLVQSISSVSAEDRLQHVPAEETPRHELIDKLVQTAERFESRARTFRDIHPLSLQVIVRSGVLNGILVTRSVEDCGRLLTEVIANTVEMDVEVDDSNYRLVEQKTRSTLRVVSRHRLLTFAFWAQYFDDTPTALPMIDLPAATL